MASKEAVRVVGRTFGAVSVAAAGTASNDSAPPGVLAPPDASGGDLARSGPGGDSWCNVVPDSDIDKTTRLIFRPDSGQPAPSSHASPPSSASSVAGGELDHAAMSKELIDQQQQYSMLVALGSHLAKDPRVQQSVMDAMNGRAATDHQLRGGFGDSGFGDDGLESFGGLLMGDHVEADSVSEYDSTGSAESPMAMHELQTQISKLQDTVSDLQEEVNDQKTLNEQLIYQNFQLQEDNADMREQLQAARMQQGEVESANADVNDAINRGLGLDRDRDRERSAAAEDDAEVEAGPFGSPDAPPLPRQATRTRRSVAGAAEALAARMGMAAASDEASVGVTSSSASGRSQSRTRTRRSQKGKGREGRGNGSGGQAHGLGGPGISDQMIQSALGIATAIIMYCMAQRSGNPKIKHMATTAAAAAGAAVWVGARAAMGGDTSSSD